MKIKVCGMKDPQNIKELACLPVDFMGLIFYPKSSRYAAGLTSIELNDSLSKGVKRVGVFVDEKVDVILSNIKKYDLDYVQLHGSESPDICKRIKMEYPHVGVIKVFSVSESFDFEDTKEYEAVSDYFLFDTKTPQYGGSGQKFDWSVLDSYKGSIPFFLSGGISSDDIEAIKSIKHPRLFALDLNSKFEVSSGYKNIELLKIFIDNLKNIKR